MMSFLFKTKTISENALRSMGWKARFFGIKSKGIPGTKEQRTGAYFLTIHEMQKRSYILPVEAVSLCRFGPKKLDDDNLRGALKAIRDGVSDALGIDDGDSRVRWEYDQEAGSKQYSVYVKIVEKGDRVC